jgi:tRNA-binding EMAP/Myf-like protein
MLQVKTDNKNYLARVVKLPKLTKHINADRLQVCIIDANSIITGLTAKEGDLYVYFPLECAINSEYLSYSNSFSSADLNQDKSIKGYFGNSGRVKATSLRGQKSEGYIVPITSIHEWLATKDSNINLSDFKEGAEFSHWNDILVCEKYINKKALRQQNQNSSNKKVARASKIIDGQFYFHKDTAQLGRYIKNISPNSLISISKKLHGSSFVVGKVLCKKSLKWHERLLQRFGVKIVDFHYDLVYSSRTVIKNQYNDNGVPNSGYYDTDIWGIVAKQLEPFINDGVTLYGEIVGYTPSGAPIQKKYDYGCEPCKLDTYIYRITINSNGKVFEMSRPQVDDYCNKYGIKAVPLIYYGRAKDLFDIQLDDNWHDNFIAKLSETYLEKDCDICKNKVPAEGIVIRLESDTYEAFKHKSFRFKKLESEELDTGEIDIETAESISSDVTN